MNCLYKIYKWDKDTVGVINALVNRKNLFFLDSSMNVGGLGRYSFIGSDPAFILKSVGRSDPFGSLSSTLNEFKLPLKFSRLSPFLCGLCGYLSYDLGFILDNKEKSSVLKTQVLPTSYFGFYDTVITVDHFKKTLIVFSSGLPEKKSHYAKLRAKERFDDIVCLLAKASDDKIKHHEIKVGNLESNFTYDSYIRAVNKAKKYIEEGQIYQINLSQRFKGECRAEPLSLYYNLRRIFPSSFSAYFDCVDFQILSSSPERFLKLEKKKAITRPMKGTRPRGKTTSEDEILRDELIDSEKDKAELLMIVDLERNDLGRVCEYDSVKVTQARTLETYATLFQTTAQIEGKLYKSKDAIDLLRASFPGGSITGCPKIRAMQIIDELEPAPRNVYTGSLGYLNLCGNMDFNILIRTMVLKDGNVYFQAGGGIVADSNAESEYEETLVKSKAMFRALGIKNEDIFRR
ncbi:MAG TPA: aminodeoxychorismate synthase component I [Candidatus Omnitrophica bacterium]|nr:aminodeoxychorismate synthase component I [Candidatus Omnitrophota bacterium]